MRIILFYIRNCTWNVTYRLLTPIFDCMSHYSSQSIGRSIHLCRNGLYLEGVQNTEFSLFLQNLSYEWFPIFNLLDHDVAPVNLTNWVNDYGISSLSPGRIFTLNFLGWGTPIMASVFRGRGAVPSILILKPPREEICTYSSSTLVMPYPA